MCVSEYLCNSKVYYVWLHLLDHKGVDNSGCMFDLDSLAGFL